MEQRDDTFPSIWIVACSARFWPDGYSSYKRPCRGLPNNTALQSIRPCLPSATFPKAACETLFFFVRGDRVQVTRIWLVGLDPKGCRNTATEGQFGHRLKALDYFWGPQNTLRCVGSNLYDTEWITVREQSDKCQYKFFTFAVLVNCPPRNSEWNF